MGQRRAFLSAQEGAGRAEKEPKLVGPQPHASSWLSALLPGSTPGTSILNLPFPGLLHQPSVAMLDNALDPVQVLPLPWA